MLTRISERKFLFAFLLLVASLYTLYAVQLIKTPVIVSEKGVLIAVAAIAGLMVCARLMKAATKQV